MESIGLKFSDADTDLEPLYFLGGDYMYLTLGQVLCYQLKTSPSL